MARPAATAYEAPDLGLLLRAQATDLRDAIERYNADSGSLHRFYDVPSSPATQQALRQFYRAWLTALEKLNFEALGADARIDYILFRNKLDQELGRLDA